MATSSLAEVAVSFEWMALHPGMARWLESGSGCGFKRHQRRLEKTALKSAVGFLRSIEKNDYLTD